MELRSIEPLLEIKNLCLHYGSQKILNDISLSIRKGEVAVIIGPSGGGKSSLLRSVNLIQPIASGHIILSGEKLNAPGVDINLVRQRIGMVFQQYHLFPHLSILGNLTLAPRRVLNFRDRQPRNER